MNNIESLNQTLNILAPQKRETKEPRRMLEQAERELFSTEVTANSLLLPLESAIRGLDILLGIKRTNLKD